VTDIGKNSSLNKAHITTAKDCYVQFYLFLINGSRPAPGCRA